MGPPGPVRRRLAMRFAEICQLEIEYLAITQDTTGCAKPSSMSLLITLMKRLI